MTRPTSPGTALDDADPRHVGPYTLIRRLGAGGMGTVYLATDPAGRHVAVKVVRADMADDPEFRARFAREARHAARVPRFCTAALLTADPDGPIPYLATEYVPGPTLAAHIAQHGPLPPADAEHVAINVLTALSAIHGAGVVHRDLKPGNVILGPTGARVIDFGISRATRHDTATLTGHQVTVGTPAFMTPEQIIGLPVTPATDLFAWGGLVIYAATGHYPFGTDHVALVGHRVLREPPDTTGLPPALHAAVTAAMHKNPTRRPATTDLYRMLLGTAQPTPDPHPPAGAPPTPPPRAPRTAMPQPLPAAPPPRRARGGGRRAPLVAFTATAILTAAVAVPLVFLRGHPTGTAAQDPPSRPGDLTAASHTLATRAAHATDSETAVRLALAAYRLADTAETRAALISASAALGVAENGEIRVTAGAINEVDVSPDGKTLVTAPSHVNPQLWDISGKQPRLLAELPAEQISAQGAVFSPNGTTAVTAHADGIARIWTTTHPSTPTAEITDPAGPLYEIALSPDGTTLAVGSNDGTTHLWNIENPSTPEQLGVTTLGQGPVASIAFTPDGDTLAISNGNENVARLWTITDPNRPRLAATLTGHTQPIWNLQTSRNIVATAGTDGTTRIWTITNPAQPHLESILPDGTSVTALDISPDGNTLATANTSGTVQLWNITNPNKPSSAGKLAGHTATVRDLTYTPDGKTLITSSHDGTTRLWNTDPTRLAETLCSALVDNINLTEQEWQGTVTGLPYEVAC
ncbi:serine/threonine-protein kinase [Parafrankia sp. BMG5.11]|uniref:serine/threonine-protein kinase n=1 Tax=Parafrankia sp. BMG5.11 TaxID=222540 RepID=UPI00104009E4|nr:serine/threonine-protein kinase [Parafrankia sp. BMG5.11]TCJ35900.1 serine/threonine protein kinase [Parafrankia sp. BMG5.11]